MGFSMESTTEWKMGVGAHTPAPQPWDWGYLFVCLVRFFTFNQQSFSYTGTGLPWLNKYARINVSCSRTTTQ